MITAPRVAMTLDVAPFARIAPVVLALVTTSFFVPWAAACARLADSSHALLLAGGLVSGFLAGLLGIGGALVTLPVLYAALPGLGVPAESVPTVAVATSLVAMVPTTVVAAWRQHAHGALDIGTIGRMVGPMASGACVGALLASSLHGPVLALLFAIQALCYGGSVVARRDDNGAGRVATTVGRFPSWIAGPALSAFCACVGMGGASMVTPYLQQRFQLPFRHAVATSSALNLCIAFGGSLAFFVVAHHGPSVAETASPNVPAAVLLAGGAVAAVSLGVSVAHRLPTPLFRRAVGAINLIAAVVLILQVTHAA